ncbi:hypothetical protein [Dactylosporangium sp. NPDC005555]|uniref:hypothetical protein n=1 Tax=Dactylosporangium sp. NPDC005555 TaxID=3154889 RepID=UPI0033B6F12A
MFQDILRLDGTTGIEDRIAPLSIIFELQGTRELLARDAACVRAERPASVQAQVASPVDELAGK